MVRLLKKLLILFFDILYVVMFAFAIGFVKQLRFDCSVIDFTVAVLLYTALRFYLHKKSYERFSQKFSLQVALLWLYLFLLLTLPTAFVWAKKTFPVQNPDLTIMTLQMPVEGFVSVFVQDFFSRIGFYTLILSLSLLWPICDLYQNLKFRKIIFAVAFGSHEKYDSIYRSGYDTADGTIVQFEFGDEPFASFWSGEGQGNVEIINTGDLGYTLKLSGEKGFTYRFSITDNTGHEYNYRYFFDQDQNTLILELDD